jgi:hypothetical protein
MSNAIRLAPREWGATLVALLAVLWLTPIAWRWIEPLERQPEHRIPYSLGNDYWMYQRLVHDACQHERLLALGDSVVWGHWVSPAETLSAHLNQLDGRERVVNLGVDGAHPVALAGLVEDYGREITGRPVLLHCNLLWISSRDADLQGDKERSINHAALIPQFSPRIPCYYESTAKKVGNVLRRHVSLLGWADHLQTAHFADKSLARWALKHPYQCPFRDLMVEASSPDERPAPGPSGGAVSAPAPRLGKSNFAWVPLEDSLQWRYFRRTVEVLRQRGNRVFVVIGPFNEHLLTERSRQVYADRKQAVAAWLAEQGVPHHVAILLPVAEFADASHPIGAGYARMARELRDNPSFRSLGF